MKRKTKEVSGVREDEKLIKGDTSRNGKAKEVD